MTNVAVTVSGGAVNNGVYNINSSPMMTNLKTTVTGGTGSNNGVRNVMGGIVKINHSVIHATPTIVNDNGVTTLVGTTQLDGGSVLNFGTLKCIGVYDGNYDAYTCLP
jgi:hypothetical protein